VEGLLQDYFRHPLQWGVRYMQIFLGSPNLPFLLPIHFTFPNVATWHFRRVAGASLWREALRPIAAGLVSQWERRRSRKRIPSAEFPGGKRGPWLRGARVCWSGGRYRVNASESAFKFEELVNSLAQILPATN